MTATSAYLRGRVAELERELARVALRHSGKAIKTHDGISSDAWCSPPEIAAPLHHMYGRPIGTDPCTNERSIVRAHRRLTAGGLTLPWGVDGIPDDAYANWPYSQNDPWATKARAELDAARISELVILCMTASSTQWWRSLMIKPRRNPRVLALKRVKFLGPDGKPVDSSRFEPSIIYYGPRAKKLDREFASITMWSTWGR